MSNKTESPKVRLAFMQEYTRATPAATIDILDKHIAGLDPKPHLLLTPEAFIGGYPRGHGFGMVVGSRTQEGRDLYYRYYTNCIAASRDDEHVKRLEEIAKKYGVFLVVGAVVKGDAGQAEGSLWCAVLYIDPEKGLVGWRGKVMPTGSERTIWCPTLQNPYENQKVIKATLNGQELNIFAAICWENFLPLLRMNAYRQGVDIWLAPTADSRESWASTMRHIAMEGRCYVVSCNQVLKNKDVVPEPPKDLDPEAWASRGGGMVVGPLGDVRVEPVWEDAGVVEVEVGDVRRELIGARVDFHAVGNYTGNVQLLDFSNRLFSSTSGSLFGSK